MPGAAVWRASSRNATRRPERGAARSGPDDGTFILGSPLRERTWWLRTTVYRAEDCRCHDAKFFELLQGRLDDVRSLSGGYMFDSRDETTQERSFEEERAALLTGLWDGSRAIALAERLMRLVDGSEPSLSIARRDAVDA